MRVAQGLVEDIAAAGVAEGLDAKRHDRRIMA
jgi:hypothetical protein